MGNADATKRRGVFTSHGYAIAEVDANGWDADYCNRNEPARKQEGSGTDEIFI